MKVALFKLGPKYNLSITDTSGAVGEVISICKILKTAGVSIDLYTGLSYTAQMQLYCENIFCNIDDYRKINKDNYDIVIAINGVVSNTLDDNGYTNFIQSIQLNVINDADIPVYYFLCDPLILPKVLNVISQNVFRKITRKLRIISQPYNITSVSDLFYLYKIEYDSIQHFPFYKFPLWFSEPSSTGKTVDLLYGGNFRNGTRKNKIEEFYTGLNHRISVEIVGRIKKEDINNSDNIIFSDPVPHDKFQDKLSTALATVAIGDDWYNGTNFNQRIFEAINADVVCFIDAELDPNRLIYGHSKKADFLYVTNKNDLISKMNDLKRFTQESVDEYLDFQYESTYENYQTYCNTLKKLLVK
jgi:hypothetical protein